MNRENQLNEEEKPSQEEDKNTKKSLFAEKYWNYIWRLFKRWGFTDSDCDDLTQETFLRISKGKFEYKKGAKPISWAYGIAFRVFQEKCRKDKQYREMLNAIVQGTANSELDCLNALEECKNRLDEETKKVIEMREENDYKEISVILHKPSSTLRSMYSRGIAKIRECMEKKGYVRYE